MIQQYDYKVVRVGKGFFETRKSARDGYAQVIDEYARQGWRFIQVFAPGHGINGVPRYYDLIFEKEMNRD